MNTTPNPNPLISHADRERVEICSSSAFLLFSSGDDNDKTSYCEMLKRKNELVINAERLRAHTGK